MRFSNEPTAALTVSPSSLIFLTLLACTKSVSLSLKGTQSLLLNTVSFLSFFQIQGS